MERTGVATKETVGIDTLVERLREEAVVARHGPASTIGGGGAGMEFRCRECGSERITPNVRLAAASAAGLLGRLRARVCADCGYTELRTDDALPLYLAHMREVGGVGTAAAPGSDRQPRPGETPAANIQCPSCGSVLPAAATTCEVCGWSQEAPAS